MLFLAQPAWCDGFSTSSVPTKMYAESPQSRLESWTPSEFDKSADLKTNLWKKGPTCSDIGVTNVYYQKVGNRRQIEQPEQRQRWRQRLLFSFVAAVHTESDKRPSCNEASISELIADVGSGCDEALWRRQELGALKSQQAPHLHVTDVLYTDCLFRRDNTGCR